MILYVSMKALEQFVTIKCPFKLQTLYLHFKFFIHKKKLFSMVLDIRYIDNIFELDFNTVQISFVSVIYSSLTFSCSYILV